MKLFHTVGAAVLSMSLITGCAVDLDTSQNELDNDPSFEATGCLVSSTTLIRLEDWPTNEVVVGDVIYTRDDILDLLGDSPTNPTVQALLEFSAAINSLATGLELPATVHAELDDAEAWLADPNRDDRFVPPVVNGDFTARIDLTKIRGDTHCFDDQNASAAATLGDEGDSDPREQLHDRYYGND